MTWRLVIVDLIGMLLLVGCTRQADLSSSTGPSTAVAASGKRESSGTTRAVATVGMVADVVRNIGGDLVEVNQLMGAGVDPHLYKATRDDVQTIIQG
ncbi:MAG: zinc ABC transporter substrate-binding protein, partial [Pirellulales bacterium]